MSILYNLLAEAQEIKSNVKELLFNYSSLYHDPFYSDYIIAPTRPDYYWNELSLEGKQLQSKIIGSFDSYIKKVNTYVQDIPQSQLREIEKSVKNIRKIIEHSKGKGTFIETIQKNWEAFDKDFTIINTLLSSIYSITKDQVILVVDTNSLLTSPDIENWSFDLFDNFFIYLTPTVLSELDKLKNNPKNQNIQIKAKKIINKIKEYRRRGNILSGVPIVANKISLYSIAVEPNFDNTFDFLDSQNNDDRLIASTIEIMRKNTHSTVYLVSEDLNLQNKASFASIPVLETPVSD